MGGEGVQNSERSVSEIYGTFLIVSLVIITAIVVAGMGALAFDQLTDESDDDLVRQSMLEMDDRIADLTGDDIETATTVSFPEGTAEDIEAQPNRGTINITVETHGDEWHVTDPDGALVDANEQRDSWDETVGTIVHEDDDGVKTAYQAGGVWQKQDGHVTMVSPPDLDIREGSFDLSFVDISDVELIQEGQELTISKDPESSAERSEEIMGVVHEQMRSDGDTVARANVTLTITSEYAEGWHDYAKNLDGVDDDDVTHHSASELPGEIDRVEIELGTFGDTLAHVLDEPRSFGEGVIYTGVSEYAPNLYNETEGHVSTITDPESGFDVTDPDEYTVGMLYDDGAGHEWWAWNSSHWVNVENPQASAIEGGDVTIFDDGPSDDEFEVNDPDAWTCAVNTTESNAPDEFRDEYVPAEYEEGEDNGCLNGPIGIEDAEDRAGDFRPYLEIEDFEATVVDADGNDVTGAKPYVVGEHNVSITLNGTNTGFAKADEEPVAIIRDEDTDMDDPSFAYAELWGGDVGDSFNVSTTFQPWKGGSFAFSGSSTYDDVSEENRTEYFFEEAIGGTFTATITDGDIEGQVGESLPVNVTVENHADAAATQPVYLRPDGEDDILDAKSVELDARGDENDSTEITFEDWEPVDDSVEEINVTTRDDFDTADVEIDDVDDAEFEIEDIDDMEAEVGETLDVDFVVSNTGDRESTQSILLENENDIDGEIVTIDGGETEDVTLSWAVTSEDVGDHTLEVTTEDDEEEFDVTVTGTQFEIDILGTDPGDEIEAGNRLTVSVGVTNTGGQEDTKLVEAENFDGERVDIESVTLEEGESRTIDLHWDTRPEDIGKDDVTVLSPDDEDTREIEIVEEAEPDFDITIDENGTDSSVIEGQPLEVTAEIENEGGAGGEINAVLTDISETAVNATSISLEAGETRTVSLTWYTLVGDADDDEPADGEVTVEGEGTMDSTDVQVDPMEQTRPPVDVMFVLDETGSMGAYQSWTDWMYVKERKTLTESETVPEGDNVWATTQPVGWWHEEGDDYFVSGQTIDPDDYGGSVEIVKLGKHSDCGMCYDAWGDRYFATLTGIGGLNGSKDRAGLLEFDTTTNVYQGITSDLDEVNESLFVNPGGGTDIAGGMETAKHELSDAAGERDEDHEQVMIVLTDGEDNTGEDPEDWADENVGEPFTTYTVGFGGANPDELEYVAGTAGTGDGEFIEAENSGELAEIFDGLVADITEQEPPEYVIADVEVYNSTVEEGDPIGMDIEIENVGETANRQPVLLFDTGFNDFPVAAGTKNVSGGDTGTVTLEWDTTDTIDWDEHGSAVTGDLTIVTPADDETVEVTIEEPPEGEFLVDITGTNTSPDEPIVAGEDTLEVSVDVENVGEAEDEQTLVLERGDGSTTPSSQTVSLGPDETNSTTLAWEISPLDDGLSEVTVTTGDDDDTTGVYVDPPEEDVQVEITDRDESVAAGTVVDVTATVVNNGDLEEGVSVTLLDFDGETVDGESVHVPSNESTEVDLSWQTDEDEFGHLPVEEEITVIADEDSATAPVTLTVGGFTVEIDGTNADDGAEYIVYQQEPLEVDATISNNGSFDAQAITLLDAHDNELATWDGGLLPLDNGDSETITIEWQPDNADVEDVIVETEDDSDSRAVDIRSEGTANISIAATSNASSPMDSVDAGETVDVTAEITAEEEVTRSGVLVVFEAVQGDASILVGFESADLDLDEGDSKKVHFDWDTEPWFGDDDPWIVTVETLGETSDPGAEVYLDEIAGGSPGGPGFGEGGGEIDIEIDDLEIS